MTAQIGTARDGALSFGRPLPNISASTGLGHSAPLGGGLTNNARLSFLRPSNRWTSAFAVHSCGRGRAVLARAI